MAPNEEEEDSNKEVVTLEFVTIVTTVMQIWNLYIKNYIKKTLYYVIKMSALILDEEAWGAIGVPVHPKGVQ